MYISYDHYRIFYYVARYGNVTKAAKRLMNNQPNLTRRGQCMSPQVRWRCAACCFPC